MPFGSFRLRRTKRQGQRGAAALEFALSMLILTPILIGICEYAYYFYIGINAVEAERAGLLAATRTVVSNACTATPVGTAQTAAAAAVTAYFHQNSLDTVVTVMNSSSTPTCSTNSTTAPAPWWSMDLAVDYHPFFGVTMPWEKKSPNAGYLRYYVGQLAVRGQ